MAYLCTVHTRAYIRVYTSVPVSVMLHEYMFLNLITNSDKLMHSLKCIWEGNI